MFLNGKRQCVGRRRHAAMPELVALIVNDGNIRLCLRDIKTGKSRHGSSSTGCVKWRSLPDSAFRSSDVARRDKSMWTALHPEPGYSLREARGRATMMRVATIGLDIAKTVFQVHGVDAGGEVVVRQRLARRRVLAFFEKLAPCLVGIEACSTSHYWARELIARGHEVRLMPAQYVKAYVKRGKNDAADAEAICEAVM